MSARLLTRSLMRPHVVGTGIGLSLGAGMMLRNPRRLKMDSRPVPRSSTTTPRESRATKEALNPEMMKQLSGGSIAGFVSGLVISIFSKTLVLLLGLSVVVVQVASRYGIDLVKQLKLRQRFGNSRVLTALETNPAFKLSFGLFFAMSAFMQF